MGHIFADTVMDNTHGGSFYVLNIWVAFLAFEGLILAYDRKISMLHINVNHVFVMTRPFLSITSEKSQLKIFWQARPSRKILHLFFFQSCLQHRTNTMADTLPWVDEAAAKDAIAAVRKDSDPTDWYEFVLTSLRHLQTAFSPYIQSLQRFLSLN
jgi:hypothetical protein